MNKKNNDTFRHFLDEIESMIENEKRTFREIKESIKDSFSDKSIPELLKKRRRAYDHAFVECMNKYGFGSGNVRQELDDIWDENIIEQAEWKQYLRSLKVLNTWGLLTQAAAIYFDDTYKLKKKQWHSYLDDSFEIAKRYGKSND